MFFMVWNKFLEENCFKNYFFTQYSVLKVLENKIEWFGKTNVFGQMLKHFDENIQKKITFRHLFFKYFHENVSTFDLHGRNNYDFFRKKPQNRI